MLCPGYTGVKGNKWADWLLGKATITSLKWLAFWMRWSTRCFRNHLQAQSQGHYTINRLEKRVTLTDRKNAQTIYLEGLSERSAIKVGNRRRAQWSTLEGWKRAFINQMNFRMFRETQDRMEHIYMAFFEEHRLHLGQLKIRWTLEWLGKSERQDKAHIAFAKHTDSIWNWSEPRKRKNKTQK